MALVANTPPNVPPVEAVGAAAAAGFPNNPVPGAGPVTEAGLPNNPTARESKTVSHTKIFKVQIILVCCQSFKI